MSRGKKKPVVTPEVPVQEEVNSQIATTEEVNQLMSVYRESVLPTPVLLWRTEGKTVAAWELSESDFERISFILGIDNG